MKRDGLPAVASQITVRNLQRSLAVNLRALDRFAGKALALCLKVPRDRATRLTKLKNISVLLVSDRRMARLHQRFLNQSGPTDVITFQHGEIVISVETARRHARKFRSSLSREIQLYIVHGLLHLHGFGDNTTAASREMKVIQKKITTAAMKS